MVLVSFIIWKAIERTNCRFQSRGDDTCTCHVVIIEFEPPSSTHWKNFCFNYQSQIQAVQPSYKRAKLSRLVASRMMKSTCSATEERRKTSGSRPSSFALTRLK